MLVTSAGLWIASDNVRRHRQVRWRRQPRGHLPPSLQLGHERGDELSADALASRAGTSIVPGGPRVVYLAGLGRSGSTLLERLLGEMPGACPAGEVVHMWLRSVRDDERCGCGQAFSACPFWQQVGRAAFGGWDAAGRGPGHPAAGPGGPGPVPAAARLRPAAEHGSSPPWTSTSGTTSAPTPAIGQVSGSPVVIDSSKHASLAFCLRSSPGAGPEGRPHGPRQPGGGLLLEQGRGPAGRGRQPDGHL